MEQGPAEEQRLLNTSDAKKDYEKYVERAMLG